MLEMWGRTYMHAFWECSKVCPLWRSVLDSMGKWLKCDIPTSPRLCLLGDRTVTPHLNKCAFRVLKAGLITCARIILRCWKDPQTPTLNMWRVQMMENAACEKMLGRLNVQSGMANEQWDSFSRYMSGEGGTV